LGLPSESGKQEANFFEKRFFLNFLFFWQIQKNCRVFLLKIKIGYAIILKICKKKSLFSFWKGTKIKNRKKMICKKDFFSNQNKKFNHVIFWVQESYF
jgi:hypothetical protein